jgi:putative spermidine/putrescine transport system substrate-binding protein
MAVMAAAPALSQESIVVVSNGGPVQKAAEEAFYKPFTEKTGVAITEDSWSQEYARLRSQADTGNITWDVVEITYNNVALGCDEGILEKVDWAKYVDVSDFEAAGGVHPCGIPTSTVVNGLVYDADVFKDEQPRTWADFWDVKKFPGNRAMLSRPTVIVFALLADGVPTSEIMSVLNSPGGVDRAFAKLDEIKPYIRWWRTGAEPMEMLANKEVVMAQAWNSRTAVAALNDGRNFKISYDGGVTGGNQLIAIMKGSKNLDRAIEFVSYAVSPESLAKYNGALKGLSASTKSAALVSSELAQFLPTEAQMTDAFIQAGEEYDAFWFAHLDELTQRLAVWQAK